MRDGALVSVWMLMACEEGKMRKTITGSDPELQKQKSSWLDVKAIARVEVTSEDSRYPIESAFEEDGHGWRSAETGEQTITLVFDQPQRIQLIRLCFVDTETERTQRFTLQWSTDHSDALLRLVQQEWNFSPKIYHRDRGLRSKPYWRSDASAYRQPRDRGRFSYRHYG
jgi:hypothetical protein